MEHKLSPHQRSTYCRSFNTIRQHLESFTTELSLRELVFLSSLTPEDAMMIFHQQKTFLSGRNGSVRVDALRQSRQRHPGGRLLRARHQYHASRSISPSDRRFAVSSRSVGPYEIHTLSFPSFDLTHSFYDFVDLRNCVDPRGRVVSYLLTLILHSSSQVDS